MKCAFICASLEPGRDGVGDYCRGLSEELIALGHQPVLLALNDSYVSKAEKFDTPLLMLRLPQSLDWKTKSKLALQFIQEVNPDWVSFQFVSYGINPKGLVRGYPEVCAPLIAGRRVHAMCHELWIGAANNSSLKDRAIGFIQKKFILRWLRAIKPRVAHTTNRAYRELLARVKISAEILPLFGNIPVASTSGEWMKSELARLGISESNRELFWIFGIFGNIPEIWDAQPFVERVLPLAGKKNKRIVIATIGRHGAGERAIRTAEEKFRGRLQVLQLGPRPEEQISEFLCALDFGVATVPWNLFGKSGAAAAMLDHGLPVIVTRNDVQFDFPQTPVTDSRIILLNANFESRLVDAARAKPAPGRARVAAEFCRALERAA